MAGNAYDSPYGRNGSYGGGVGGPPGGVHYGGTANQSTVKSNQSDGSIINSRDSPNNTKMFVGGISKNTSTGNFLHFYFRFFFLKFLELTVRDFVQYLSPLNYFFLMTSFISFSKRHEFINLRGFEFFFQLLANHFVI